MGVGVGVGMGEGVGMAVGVGVGVGIAVGVGVGEGGGVEVGLPWGGPSLSSSPTSRMRLLPRQSVCSLGSGMRPA